MAISTVITLCALSLTSIGMIISILTFTINRGKDNTKEGEWRGRLDGKIENLTTKVGEIKSAVNEGEERYKKSLEEIRLHFKDNVRKMNTRLDNHLREQHNMDVPDR